MTVVILIALFYVSSVIDSRQAYRDEAAKSIAESYAGARCWWDRYWCDRIPKRSKRLKLAKGH